MSFRKITALMVLAYAVLVTASTVRSQATAAEEYAKHFAALSQLSVAVAQAMPPDLYGFRPHPESMDFRQLMSHIASTNYQFCAGLKDSNTPNLPSPTAKDGIVKFLS